MNGDDFLQVRFQTRPINEYVANILSTKQTIEEKVASSQLKLFADSGPVTVDEERERRKMTFETEESKNMIPEREVIRPFRFTFQESEGEEEAEFGR